jgi:TolB-like protein/Tfp pilus assembly protein PilF
VTITAGTRLGRYDIRAKIGEGGMGEVYLAVDTKLDRKVAIKILPAEVAADRGRMNRFVQEAKAASALNHPNVLTIYEVDDTESGHFIVTELIEGETLRARLRRAPMKVEEVLKVATQIASALVATHTRGIIHRDIKPDNVMLKRDGLAKVLDFGLAKLSEPKIPASDPEAPTHALLKTEPGTVMGTSAYMSPEQARGAEVDARTDLWSLGVVLYEMIAGCHPFQGETPTEVIAQVLERQPPPLAQYVPNVRSELQRIVNKALVKDPEHRYQTARDLLLDLKALKEELELEARLERSAPRARQPTDSRRPALLMLAGFAVVVALGAAVVIYFLYLRRAAVTPKAEIQSLAVLPLDNLSGDSSQDYFADGMTETLIANLGKIESLRVISRTSVMQYKGARRPLPEIARELHVDAVIEGSVERAGGRVRITAQLIEAATDRHLWAESYDGDLRDVLALQSQVAAAIAQAIKGKLAPQSAPLAANRQVDPQAYEAYLKGLVLSNHPNKPDNDVAIDALERAVKIDPNFAQGYAALARAYTVKFSYLAPGDQQIEAKALAAVEKALALDPDSAEAHLARGFLFWTPSYHYPHERVVQEYRRALTLNPNLDEAHHQLGLVYIHVGLFDRAMQEIQTAVGINPSNELAQFRVGVDLLYEGKYEEALAIFRKYPEIEASPLSGYQIAWALFSEGKKDEARSTIAAELKRDPEDQGGNFHSVAAMLAAADGDQKRAEDMIRGSQEKGRGFIHFHHSAYNIASAYALMKKPAEALKWLQLAADDGLPCYPLFERDPNLDNLRQVPQFIEFMAKQKAQWEYYKAGL